VVELCANHLEDRRLLTGQGIVDRGKAVAYAECNDGVIDLGEDMHANGMICLGEPIEFIEQCDQEIPIVYFHAMKEIEDLSN